MTIGVKLLSYRAGGVYFVHRFIADEILYETPQADDSIRIGARTGWSSRRCALWAALIRGAVGGIPCVAESDLR